MGRRKTGTFATSTLARAILIATLDIIAVAAAFFFALWMRHDFEYSAIPDVYLDNYQRVILPWCAICVLMFTLWKLYSSIWIYASVPEALRILGAYLCLGALATVGDQIFQVVLPVSCYIIGFLLSLSATVTIRFGYRFARNLRRQFSRGDGRMCNVMIIGGGEAGRALITEFETSHYVHDRVVCVIDDNPFKHGRRLCGVPIVGGRERIAEMVREYEVRRIIFAIPTADAADRKEILSICATTGCKVQVVPGMFQLVNGEVSVSSLRSVNPQDLLGRDPIRVNLDEIMDYVSGKTVLVTGGGGSIGSELCRQIAKATPKKLIIFDIYENNAYDIQMELQRRFPELELAVLIGSVRNTARLESVMATHKPELVFHAAAHKHVPLMEDSPNEAVKNNVLGTWKLAKAAAAHGVKRFVLISTDKAVNPTNIMGASKRLCEMVVQMMNRASATEFVAVRFGNVLGSNGSVIPLFRKQIEEGGPVTVTHPEIIRYFMTIPEAVSLVLQAGYYARGGEIFVLDMGAPVKIDDMARNMIRLSGLEPDVDIAIRYTGLRPGEKLYEELLMKEEGLRETDNHRIHVGRPIEMDDERFCAQLAQLEQACEQEADNMKELVAQMVPTYRPQTK